jgi:5-methylcytosine-specific restriction endonuclease McrA
MRRIIKDFDKPPVSLQSQAVKNAVAILLSSEDKSVIHPDLYRGKIILSDGTSIFEVVNALRLIYHNKCAYCETKEFDPQIEHYRPKNKVTGARNHLGYYWLAFEWTNLVPSCFDCNKIGTGKGNRFPLIGGEGNRLSKPPLMGENLLDVNEIRPNQPKLMNERPYLLHPEFDDADLFFSFDNEGVMSGVDTDGRGKETIKICNLNRKNLRYRRQSALEFFTTNMQYAIQAFEADVFNNEQLLVFLNLILQRFEEWGQQKEEYSLFGKYAFENFESIVLPLFPLAYRATLEEAYKRFRAGAL